MARRISSGSAFEDTIGFSRAVRCGNLIAVSGTAPIGEDGATHAPGDAYRQTLRCIAIARAAIEAAGASLDAVIRTRILLTDIADYPAAARAHGEVFGSIKPACTVMQVSGFIDPDWLVELEIDCVVDSD